MVLERKLNLSYIALLFMGAGYVFVGAFIHWQQDYIEHVNWLLSLSLAQLSEVRIDHAKL